MKWLKSFICTIKGHKKGEIYWCDKRHGIITKCKRCGKDYMIKRF